MKSVKIRENYEYNSHDVSISYLILENVVHFSSQLPTCCDTKKIEQFWKVKLDLSRKMKKILIPVLRTTEACKLGWPNTGIIILVPKQYSAKTCKLRPLKSFSLPWKKN